MVDGAGRVVACNQRFAALCDAPEADLAGKPLSSLELSGAARLERRPLPPPAEGELVVAGPRTPDPTAEERFRVLCEAAPIGVFLTDARGRDVYNNPRWLALTGLTQEEALGYGWIQAVHPDDRAALLDDWRRTTATGDGPWLRRHRFLAPSGEVRWVHAWAAPLRGPDGRLLGYVGTVEDVTDQVRAEASLRDSEERLRQVVQNMPFLIVAHDEQGRMAAWNRECERVTGYTAAEIVGNPEAPDLLISDAEYRGRMMQEWRERAGDFRDWEWRLTARDGSERVVAWSNLSAHYPVPGWSNWAVGVDVTARKRSEEEREGLERKLQEARRLESLGQLAGGVAHDFSNLLTAIIGYTSLARREAAGEAGRDYLDRVLQSAQRAAELCGQMLAYSGRGRFLVGPLDLSRAVRDLADLLESRRRGTRRCRWSRPTACRRCWPTPRRCARWC